MASSDSASASPECRALRRHFSSLTKAITDPLGLSTDLFSKEIIEEVTMEKVKLQNQTDREKNSDLVSAVMKRVEVSPSFFHQFVAVLKNDGDRILRELGGKLDECLKQLTPDAKEETVTKQVPLSPPPPTQQIEHPPAEQIDSPPPPPPPTQQIPPPATHPSLLSLPPQSPVRRYTEKLRAFYQTSELPASDTWLSSPSETFINLAVFSREKFSHKDLEKFKLGHGGKDQIVDMDPIEIGEILSPQSGKPLQCVLLEGAPGVGKTTLAWEASKQWGKGNLFQEFAIVMLLRLRDQTVQNAQSISDLVIYRRNREEIAQYLDDINGKNILVILEGLDELPTHLLTQSSVFTRLLSGEELPLATILVTSRPSATAHLLKIWKHRIYRHIEVLGFTDENQYITSVKTPGFQDYLSINPRIRTMMYIPLHAAIVIEVYRMCQGSSRPLPTTITELYTCFVQTVLLPYITSQPHLKGEKINHMGRFLEGITKFEGMDKNIMKKIIEEESKSTKAIELNRMNIQLSTRAIQLVYELGDASILGRLQSYGCLLTNHNSPFDFSKLGYCITHSCSIWGLQLGVKDQLMKSPEGIEKLVEAVKSHKSTSIYTYHIKSIQCYYADPQCVEQLLTMPENVLQHLPTLGLWGNLINRPPLPQCVAEVIPTMSRLHTLVIGYVTGATAVHRTVQAVVTANTTKELLLLHCDMDDDCVTTLCKWLCTSSQLDKLVISLPSPNAIEMISTALATNSTLEALSLQRSQFNLPAMQALCSMLTCNNTITHVALPDCGIDDDIICCLAESLHSNDTITNLDISRNSISDRGAVCVADILKINNTLRNVNLSENIIGIEGQMALQEVQDTKQHIQLNYTKQLSEDTQCLRDALQTECLMQ